MTATDFQGSSAEFAIKALESFYSSVPASDFLGTLHEHQRTFLLATRVLDAVALQSSDSPVRERADVASPKKASQKEAKRARMNRPGPSVDDTLFHNLGLHRPITPLEYDSVVNKIMDKLKDILRVRFVLWLILPRIFSSSIRIIFSIWELLTYSSTVFTFTPRATNQFAFELLLKPWQLPRIINPILSPISAIGRLHFSILSIP